MNGLKKTLLSRDYNRVIIRLLIIHMPLELSRGIMSLPCSAEHRFGGRTALILGVRYGGDIRVPCLKGNFAV